jgi:hypothetical protein
VPQTAINETQRMDKMTEKRALQETLRPKALSRRVQSVYKRPPQPRPKICGCCAEEIHGRHGKVRKLGGMTPPADVT